MCARLREYAVTAGEVGKRLCSRSEHHKEVRISMEEKKLRTAAYCRVSTASDTQDGSFEVQCA